MIYVYMYVLLVIYVYMYASSYVFWFKFILQIISRAWAWKDLLGLPNDKHNLVCYYSGFFVTIWINMSPVKNILVCSVIHIGIICSGIFIYFLLYNDTGGRKPYKLK